MKGKLEGSNRWLWPLAIAAAAGVQLLVASLDWGGPERLTLGDELSYLRSAREFLHSGTTDLSPLWPPLYFVFLAALIFLGKGSLIWVPWVQGALLLAAAGLLRSISRRWLGELPEAEVPAFLMLVTPSLVAFNHFHWPETLHLVLMLAVVRLLQGQRSIITSLGVGFVLGLAIGTKALLTPWVPLVVWWTSAGAKIPTGGWKRLSRMAAAVTGLLCVLLPIAAWNQQRVGVFTLSDSSAFNLWVGLSDTSSKSFVDPVAGDAYRDFRASGANFEERQDVLQQKIRQKIEQDGLGTIFWRQLKRQYFRLFDHDTSLTAQLPGGALALRGRGYTVVAPWKAWTVRGVDLGIYLLTLLLASLGLTMLKRRGGFWWAVVAFLLYNLGLFLWLHVKTRYRIQMLPGIFLLAAWGVAWLRLRFAASSPDSVLEAANLVLRPSRVRWVAFACSAALCLTLALG